MSSHSTPIKIIIHFPPAHAYVAPPPSPPPLICSLNLHKCEARDRREAPREDCPGGELGGSSSDLGNKAAGARDEGPGRGSARAGLHSARVPAGQDGGVAQVSLDLSSGASARLA